jgi:hypothetical protein
MLNRLLLVDDFASEWALPSWCAPGGSGSDAGPVVDADVSADAAASD